MFIKSSMFKKISLSLMKPGDFAFGHIHDGKNICKCCIKLVDLGN